VLVRALPKKQMRRLFLAIVAFVVGASVALYWSAVTQGQGEESASHGLGPLDLRQETDDLLLGGRRVSLEDAIATAPYEVFRPQSPEMGVGDGTVEEVWVSGDDSSTVALKYSSSLVAYLTQWPAGTDPEASYKEIASETGVGLVQMINGHPAWVVAADAQAPGFPPTAVIDITIGRVEVSLHAGPETSVDDLIKIAASISASSAET